MEYELYAPGEYLLSTIPGDGYASWSGTSMAAPVVAAMAALLRSEYPDAELYPTKFIYGQLSATSGRNADCLDVQLHGMHNLPKIVDLKAALTALPEPQVGVSDYYAFDTEGFDTDAGSVNNGDGVVYYYNFTVVKTDLSESTPSGKITIQALDTMAPNIYHTPVYTAKTGSNLVITATISNAWYCSYASFDLSLHYDASMFRLVDVSVPEEFDRQNALYSLNTATDGLVRLTCACVNSLWEYEMLKLQFEVREGAIGTTAITAEIRDICDGNRFPYLPGSAQAELTVIPAQSICLPQLWLTGDTPVIGEETTSTLVLGEGSGLAAADFQLRYDPRLLECLAVENKITSGMTPTTFEPNRTCTRGQVVTFLYRTFLS